MSKLLIFRSSTAIGGAERYVLQIIDEAARRGVTVGLVTNSRELGELAEAKAKIYVYDYAPEPFNKKRVLAYHVKYGASQARFHRLINDFFAEDEGTIFCQSLSDKMIVASLRPKQRVVWIEHGAMMGNFFKFKPLIWRYARLAASPAVGPIICVSQATKDNIVTSGAPADKMVVIYNWTSRITCHSQRNRGVCQLLTTSRLTELKGIQYLLEALKNIKKSSWHLTIVGDGDYRGELEKQAGHFPPGQVEFVGQKESVTQYLCSADIFINPTVHPGEGLPISNVEALAAGLPLVSSGYGGAKETVVDGETGLLIDPKDVETFSHKLSVLIADSHQRDEMGKNALADWGERFNSQKNLARTFEVLFPHEG